MTTPVDKSNVSAYTSDMTWQYHLTKDEAAEYAALVATRNQASKQIRRLINRCDKRRSRARLSAHPDQVVEG